MGDGRLRDARNLASIPCDHTSFSWSFPCREEATPEAGLDTGVAALTLSLKLPFYTDALNCSLPGTLVRTEATSSWTISSLLFPSPPVNDRG